MQEFDCILSTFNVTQVKLVYTFGMNSAWIHVE